MSYSQSYSFSTEAMKAGLAGVSIFVSSGDNGAPGSATAQNGYDYCACNNVFSDLPGGYNPSFPATCPYVTAVGATQGPECYTAETVCSSQTNGVITSGGGFSTLYSTPSWQYDAVSSYLSLDTPQSGFNAGGRGYPDVSLTGVDYPVIVQGSPVILFGTSASSPVFAAMIALVNSQRHLNGLGPVGFINPTLYLQNITYNDVISGDNKCCSEGLQCCGTGFTATCGWDPTTGWGSIYFPFLYEAFLTTNTMPANVCAYPWIDLAALLAALATYIIAIIAIGSLCVCGCCGFLGYKIFAPYCTNKPTIAGPKAAANNNVVNVNPMSSSSVNI